MIAGSNIGCRKIDRVKVTIVNRGDGLETH